MRTNIVIDDDMMIKALEVSGLKTKREVVELAILEFVERRTRKDLMELRGKIRFSDDYDYLTMRESR